MIPAILQRANWRWTPTGLEVHMTTSTGPLAVIIPASRVETIFQRELAAVGCPLPVVVGAGGGTHGLLARIGAANDTYTGEVSEIGVGGKKRSKAERKARRQRRRKKFFGGLVKVVKKVGQVAKKVVTNPVFRAGFAALSTVVPVLAPAAAGLEIASRVIKKIDDGKKALQKLKKKAKVGGPGDQALMQQVREMESAMSGIRDLQALAKRGDKNAQQALGNLIGAQAVLSGAA